METAKVPMYNMDVFSHENKHFWMGKLREFLELLPNPGNPHRQNFYMILLIENGSGKISVDSESIDLAGKATAIIIKPECISSINPDSAAKGYVICFTAQFFLLRYNTNILSQFYILQREAAPNILLKDQEHTSWRDLIRLCYKEFSLCRWEAETVLRSYLNIILFELDRLYSPLGLLKSNNLKQDKIQQFETLIDTNFKLNKMPSYYADLLSVSPNYLNKICRAETGYTAGGLIRKRITVEAQRLLHYTNLSVNEVANELGFDSLSYFVTSFKKQTGQTPEQFRKKSA